MEDINTTIQINRKNSGERTLEDEAKRLGRSLMDTHIARNLEKKYSKEMADTSNAYKEFCADQDDMYKKILKRENVFVPDIPIAAADALIPLVKKMYEAVKACFEAEGNNTEDISGSSFKTILGEYLCVCQKLTDKLDRYAGNVPEHQYPGCGPEFFKTSYHNGENNPCKKRMKDCFRKMDEVFKLVDEAVITRNKEKCRAVCNMLTILICDMDCVI